MKSLELGQTKSHILDDYIIIALSKKYLKLNHDLPITFDAKLENGKLILCANLARLQSTREVLTHEK